MQFREQDSYPQSLLWLRPDEDGVPALYDAGSGCGFTRAGLRAAVLEFAAVLVGLKRPLVFCFCSNSAATAIAYLACLERRCPVALLDAGLHPDLKRALVSLYEPEYLVFPHGGETPAPAFSDRYSIVASAIALVMRRNSGTSCPVHPDLAVLLSTSGSTGSPKFVRLSRRNVLSNAASIAAALDITRADRSPTSLPLHYSYGLSVLNSHLLAGAPVVLTRERVTAAGFWKTFRETECTCLAGIPYTYEVIAQLGLDRLGLPRLLTLTQAGGKLRTPLIADFSERMRDRGGRFFVMYGQTEATARISVLDPQYLPGKLGSIGKPIPGGSLELRNGGAPVASPMTEGELVYTGPNVMMGYAASPDELALGDETQGRLPTGDLGYFDQDGFFFLTGRASRFGKVLGLRLNLDELEAMFASLGRTAVIEEDQRLLVYCTNADPDAFLTCAREVAARLQLHARAFVFRPVPEIPLTAKGRPDYRALAGSLAHSPSDVS